MNDKPQRLEKIRHYLENNAVPSQVSSSDQLHQLLWIGNMVGLYDAVDIVRHQLLEGPPLPNETTAAMVAYLDTEATTTIAYDAAWVSLEWQRGFTPGGNTSCDPIVVVDKPRRTRKKKEL